MDFTIEKNKKLFSQVRYDSRLVPDIVDCNLEKFTTKVMGKEGYSQTYNYIIPANQAINFTEEEITQMKDKEIIIIPSLVNQINESPMSGTPNMGWAVNNCPAHKLMVSYFFSFTAIQISQV